MFGPHCDCDPCCCGHDGEPQGLTPSQNGSRVVDMNTTDRLAALIREIDGNHDKGAGALAEALVERGVTVETVRYCAGCGEREGSEYAKHCCTDDNMLED